MSQILIDFRKTLIEIAQSFPGSSIQGKIAAHFMKIKTRQFGSIYILFGLSIFLHRTVLAKLTIYLLCINNSFPKSETFITCGITKLVSLKY